MTKNKPFTADGFGGYHADDVSSTLRVKEPYGGGQVMIAEPIGADLYNQCTTGSVSKTLNAIKSDSDHVPCVIESIGFDSYNLCLTGGVGRTLSTPSGGLNEHIPCVIEPIVFTNDTWMKINESGGIAYSLLERDHKDPQCVVIEDAESNRNA